MKRKTSITLSEDILEAIDKRSGDSKNRSDFIETAIRSYITKLIQDEQNAKDLAIINRNADRLNVEAADVLAFQVIP
jgi:metal-responsive CopG/Arc/MetJ family transcriptional regulator